MGKVCKVLWRMVPSWVRRLRPVEWVQFRAMSTLEHTDKMENAVSPPRRRSYPVISLNLARLTSVVMSSGDAQPALAVMDRLEAMKGSGPTEGAPVPLHLASAGTDALAADVVGAALMGFDADKVGYLHYCKEMGLGAGDLAQIEIVGNATLTGCARPFRPHDTHHRQQRWMLPRAEEYLT